MESRIITLETEGITIRGQLYLPGQGNHTSYPAVCICHGIPAPAPDSSDGGYPLLAQRICQEGFAVLIFNFRGTGASSGNFDILGWTRDLKAVLDYLWGLTAVDKSRLALLGFSAGAAVSVSVAAGDKRISSVVTCACPAEFAFSSRIEEAPSLIEQFRCTGIIRDSGFPASIREWLNGFRQVKPLEYIAGIAPRRLLLVHGSQDEVVAISHAYELYARAGEPKQMAIIDGAGHRLRQSDEAMAVVVNWLKSYCFCS